MRAGDKYKEGTLHPEGAKKRPSCLLKVLEDPSLGGLFPALVAQIVDAEGGGSRLNFRLEPRFFPCCDGLGRALDYDANVTSRCGLPLRIQAVRDLLARYQAIWGSSNKPFPIDLPSKELRQLTLRLKAHADGESLKGLLFPVREEASGPGKLWAIALCAAWRFGLHVHIVNVGKHLEPSYLPSEGSSLKQGNRLGGPCLILLEQVDRLWDPRQAEELENIISYAYRSESPLWLELVERGPVKAEALRPPAARIENSGIVEERRQIEGAKSSVPQRTRPAFTHRISALKAKMPLSWISASARSKLNAIVDMAAVHTTATNSIGRLTPEIKRTRDSFGEK